jgi:dTDP-4-dehydrorhamnose 3,5-epimerase
MKQCSIPVAEFMTIRETGIEGLLIIEPVVYRDHRGYFYESYHKEKLWKSGIGISFVQDNQSRSSRGVIRGLHFQEQPHAQSKLVRVIEGTAFDVAVDIRPESSSFGKWFGIELSEENKLQLFIPAGFAHGFSVLSEYATIFYKCDAYYNAASDAGIRFDDPELGIDWQIDPAVAIISEKDKMLPYLKDL